MNGDDVLSRSTARAAAQKGEQGLEVVLVGRHAGSTEVSHRLIRAGEL